MKRYFAMVLAVVLLCICTGAMAMGWGLTDNPPPTYTVTVTKLDKVATTSGAAIPLHRARLLQSARWCTLRQNLQMPKAIPCRALSILRIWTCCILMAM